MRNQSENGRSALSIILSPSLSMKQWLILNLIWSCLGLTCFGCHNVWWFGESLVIYTTNAHDGPNVTKGSQSSIFILLLNLHLLSTISLKKLWKSILQKRYLQNIYRETAIHCQILRISQRRFEIYPRTEARFHLQEKPLAKRNWRWWWYFFRLKWLTFARLNVWLTWQPCSDKGIAHICVSCIHLQMHFLTDTKFLCFIHNHAMYFYDWINIKNASKWHGEVVW